MQVQFKIGADPEIFVGDATSVRSVIGKVGGTKELPLPLPLGDGFSVQEDNVALEFNVPAASNRQEWIANMAKVTGFLEQSMKDRYGLHFVKASAISFPQEELYDPAAFVFGCDPDYCAWTGKRNPQPKATDKNLRSCGGHVHIGLDGLDPIEVIKGCDLVLGIPSVLMDEGELRKQLYGKAGAHRIKPYGVEYRTLSNFWIHTEQLTGWVYDGVSRVLDLVSEGFDFNAEEKNIVSAINKNDKALAKELVNRYNLTLA